VMSGDRMILPDVMDEARRLLGEAEAAGITLRLLGGAAVFLRAGETLHPSFGREVKDIDLATLKGEWRRVVQFLTDQGYEPNKTFNAMHGDRRLLFYDDPNGRQLDVFVGVFEMCHIVDFSERLLVDDFTLPLAELLMTKLQIVQLNPKDRTDVYQLLLVHDVADHDREAVNVSVIAGVCGREWGMYRTLKLNLERLRGGLDGFELGSEERSRIAGRLEAIDRAIEEVPKSVKWKVRAKVGDRVKWYAEPDEVAKGGY
jgi:hypothetical protein